MAYSDEVLADSPVGYWRLDDTSGTVAEDATANNRDGTYVGSPTLGTSSLLPAGGGTAVALDGTSQRVSIAHNAAFNLVNANGFTFECWVKLDNPDAALLQNLADKTNTSTASAQWEVWYDNRNVGAGTVRALRFRYNGAASAILTWDTATEARDALAAGGHLVCVMEPFPGSTVRMYWNGVEVKTMTHPGGTPGSSTQTLSLGARSDGTGFRLDGILDEVAVYQSALSAARVAAHHTAAQVSGLAGTVAAISAIEGALNANLALEGTVTAVSAVEGAFESSVTVHDLAGQVDAVSGAQGSITITGGSVDTAEIPVGVTIETGALTIASTVTLAGTDVPVGLGLGVGATRAIVPLAGVTIPLGLSLVGRAATTQPADPRTGAPQWRYVVTDRDGTPLGELPDIEHDPVDDGVNEPGTMQLRLATSDPARALIKPIERQCEVWEGDQLLLRGPILNGRTSEDGQTVTHQVHDPSWWWRGGRRVIGRIPMLNLLKNGDFTKGLTYWTRGFDADSIPAAKPTVTIVDEDFANDEDDLDPIKAAQIVGVESVTITETELQSSAVYWPNRPFAWEPLADGFRPEGPAAIDAVANAMPSTAGLKVTIVGHTANDGTGSGMDLSLRRAEAAKARVQAIRPGAVITTRGVGFYEPNPAYPVDSQQQRRVVISYESTTTITAQSKQWIRQTVTVTQPKSARYPLELTAAAMLKVADDWSVEDANMTAIKVVARRQGSTQPWDPRLGVGSTSISDTDPVERWLGEAASATVPADDRTYEVDVYLYAAAALTRYTAVGLFPAELLYFWGVDQALIVKGGVEHMQDPAMGHGPLGVTTRTPLTGIKRDRVYPHRDRMPMETFFDEWPSLAGGMDIDVLTTRTQAIVATFHPRQGQVIDYALVQGGNVVGATPATTDDVGSSIIAQAQDLGPFRREAYARDETAFDGLVLERVITAEQETPLNELGEIARAELGWAKVTTPSYWLDIHPDRAGEVKARIAKGDTVRLVLDFPDQVDTLARVVHRKNHPSGYRLLVALEEA